MSTHAISATADMPRILTLLRTYLRQPSGIVYGNGTAAAPTALEFDPDLSAAEQTTLAKILQASARPLAWTPADEDKLAAERDLLAAYLANTSPTNAQSVAAIKALIRVVRAIVREG